MPNYTTSRNFQNYLFELQPHDDFIRRYLNQHPNAAILIIGCGDGAALKQLKKHYPNSILYGIDIKRPENCNSFGFCEHDIQNPLPSHLIAKFDLVISVATFQYVADKKAALLHAHSALKPEGYGFICCEALYYGPQAPKLFDNFAHLDIPPFRWETRDYHNILMRGTKFNHTELMAGFHQHQIPIELRSYGYPINGNPDRLAELPGFYSEENRATTYRNAFNTEAPEPLGQTLASYDYCPFLRVVESNPLGPVGAGDAQHRGYRFAAPTVYLRRAPGSSKKTLIQILCSSQSYHPALCKQNWRPDQPYLEYMAQLCESLQLPLPQRPSRFNCACNLFTAAAGTLAAAAITAAIAYSLSGP